MFTLAGTFSTSMPEPGTGVVGYNAGLGVGAAATRGMSVVDDGLGVRGAAVRATPDLGLGGAGDTTMGGKAWTLPGGLWACAGSFPGDRPTTTSTPNTTDRAPIGLTLLRSGCYGERRL